MTVALSNGETLTFTASTLAGNATLGAISTALEAAEATAADGTKYTLDQLFSVASNGGALEFTSVETGSQTAQVTGVTYNKGSGAGTLAAAAFTAWVAGEDAYEAGTSGTINTGSVNVVVNDLGDPVAGVGLTLQIGDTADSWNQLTVDIQDMYAVSLGLEGLDISKQGTAQAAVDKIKAAINTMSSSAVLWAPPRTVWTTPSTTCPS